MVKFRSRLNGPKDGEVTNNATPKVLLRLPAVLGRVPLSRSSLYAEMAAGRFPKPVKLSDRIVAWPAEEVEAWMEERKSARQAAAA